MEVVVEECRRLAEGDGDKGEQLRGKRLELGVELLTALLEDWSRWPNIGFCEIDF
jgi:hypothetical protein